MDKLPPNHVHEDFGYPRYENEIPELSTLLILYNRDKLDLMIRDHQLSINTFFVEPGFKYERSMRDFNRARTWVIVLDEGDMQILTPPAGETREKLWVEAQIDMIYLKYFPTTAAGRGGRFEHSKIEQEMDVVMTVSENWIYTPKDRRSPSRRHHAHPFTNI